MADKKYNLDESVAESFTFTLKGHEYTFRYPNYEEVMKLDEAEKKGTATGLEIFAPFIEKVSPESPEFTELVKKMIVGHIIAFRNMIKTEMTNGGN